MNPTLALSSDSSHNGLPTIGSPACPLRIDLLDRLYELVQLAIANHAEVSFIGFELYYPAGFPPCLPGNELIGSFLPRFLGPPRNDGLAPYYAWSRDQADSDRHHRYSVITLIPCHSMYDGASCLRSAEEAWCERIWSLPSDAGLVVPLPNTGTIINRGGVDFAQALGRSFAAASVLAREDTKRLGHGMVHHFGSSRTRVDAR